ncbi:hypothetical protein J5N97_008450 [Dioscorea zingiberensis]|uniref:Purple acid phosphatase N-terminal domain-containing protein n=1 Tax=Dioscorea zingiberensis TaxID=325984 RepID=A0A9D5CUR2_9LILI|nr:hypothetical protein J5N97_008450 [Dioscorea zingiberensis]
MTSSKVLPLLLLLLLPSAALAASISATPLILTKSSREITIKWTRIESPSDLDWLGIYSPSNSPDDHFIGYRFLNGSDTWHTGSGSISIPLVNTRSDYQFRIFRWTRDEVNYRHHDHDHNPLPGTRHRLAGSTTVRFENAEGPDQVHLAFTDRVDEMRVMFVTGKRSDAGVEYGLDPSLVGRRVVATTVTRYERSDMCDSPANSSLGWRDPGFIHDGVMTGLDPGKRLVVMLLAGVRSTALYLPTQ